LIAIQYLVKEGATESEVELGLRRIRDQHVFGEIHLELGKDCSLPPKDSEHIAFLAGRFQVTVFLNDSDSKTAKSWLDTGVNRVTGKLDSANVWLGDIPNERICVDLGSSELEDLCNRDPDLKSLSRFGSVCIPQNFGRANFDGLLENLARVYLKFENLSSDDIGYWKQTNVVPVLSCEPLIVSGALDAFVSDSLCQLARFRQEDSLIPTVVCDSAGIALGLVYSNADSIKIAIAEKRGVYWSRSRSEIWRKGATSGSTQVLESIDLDCDGDALKFRVRQSGSGFCHLGSRSCFGATESNLATIEEMVNDRIENPVPGSYTSRLMGDAQLLRAKVREEADELCRAGNETETVLEAADLFYFSLVLIKQNGVSVQQVMDELSRRKLKVTRRPGDAKAAFWEDKSAGKT